MGFLGEVIFELVNYLFRRHEQKQGKILWGIRLTFMGLVLTLFGLVVGLMALFQGANLDVVTALGIFLVVGIPSLLIGIFLINNPWQTAGNNLPVNDIPKGEPKK
jgi:ABC-type amino acid transport system permease subunit